MVQVEGNTFPLEVSNSRNKA